MKSRILKRIYKSFSQANVLYVLQINRSLWVELLQAHSVVDCPWLLMGDYNATLGVHEQQGGRIPRCISCADFHNFWDCCYLMQVPLFSFIHEVSGH